MIVLRSNIPGGYRILMDFGKIADTYYPHFIVERDGRRVKFSIDMKIIEGEVPVEITEEIMSWAHRHYRELEENWLNLVNTEISSKFQRRKNKLTAA